MVFSSRSSNTSRLFPVPATGTSVLPHYKIKLEGKSMCTCATLKQLFRSHRTKNIISTDTRRIEHTMNKLGRHVRPLVCKLKYRSMCSKRNIPIHEQWQSKNPWSDFFRDPERMWRGMEKMMGPRHFDAYYVRPRQAATRTEVSKLKYDSEGFELKLDVKEFSPSELKVKMTGNRLTVSAKHEQKADEHGFVARELHRELTLPEDVNLDTMTSSISEEGILTIRADIIETEKAAEKVINIQKE